MMLSPLTNAMRVLSLRPAAKVDPLVVRIAQSEPAAIGELYDQHHEAVRAFATRLLGDESSAEDVVHEVFVELPKTITRFRGDSSLRTFLIGVTVNHARRHIRSASRRRAANERACAHADLTQTTIETGTPEVVTARAQALRAVARAMDALTPDQRIAFVLCDVEERSSTEAAALVDAPEATIRTRLHHARKKMRAALEKEGY